MLTKLQYLPTCSVVICTRDRPEQLERCLKAVFRLEYQKFDVLIVDNAPKDTRAWEIARRWGTRYFMEPTPGLSHVRNCGARACNSDIIAYLDDDAIPEKWWLSGLVGEFIDPLVIAVTGQIRAFNDETEPERLRTIPGGIKLGGEEKRVFNSTSPNWFEMANFGGIGNGGNMAFRRQAFDIWPGFDERLGRGAILNGGEEHYAFFSLLNCGYRIVYTPTAVVRHPFPTTPKEIRTQYLNDVPASTAYLTFLFFQEPRYRRAIIKYIAEGIQGVRRTWRPTIAVSYAGIVPWWRKIFAYLSGPAIYVKATLYH